MTLVKDGPSSSKVAALLRAGIRKGEFSSGSFLPAIRELSKEHGVAPDTVRKALKTLEAEKLLVAEPRHGYRLLSQGEEAKGAPLAFLYSEQDISGRWEGMSGHFLQALQNAGAAHGAFVAGIGTMGRSASEVCEMLRSMKPSGVLLDSWDSALIAGVETLPLPVVMLEAVDPLGRFDAVVQDNFGGALQAADYLARRSHQRIGWVGPVARSRLSAERWFGALAGLHQHGQALDPALVLDSGSAITLDHLCTLLSRPGRPTALLALWADLAMLAGRAAARLGLKIGRDLDLVGWCTQEGSEGVDAAFPAGEIPAFVRWRIGHMAQLALERLEARRANADLPRIRIVVETKLFTP